MTNFFVCVCCYFVFVFADFTACCILYEAYVVADFHVWLNDFTVWDMIERGRRLDFAFAVTSCLILWILQFAEFFVRLLRVWFHWMFCMCQNKLYIQGVPKNDPNCFCQNFVKYPQNLIIFGMQIAKKIEICKIHLLSILPSLCQRTTV